MYFRILNKDLKRKKTMNAILFLFIVLAATFIASSANNMVSVMTALDSYFEKAGVPDYWFVTKDQGVQKQYEAFASENGYDYGCSEYLQIDPKEVTVGGKEFDYSNSLILSSLESRVNIFDSQERKITKVHDGEIYISAEIFHSSKNSFHIGSRITVKGNGKSKTFILKGYTKDAMFGSSMIGMTRFLVSEKDYNYFRNEQSVIYYSVVTNTTDPEYNQKFTDLNMDIVMTMDMGKIKLMYMMDMLMAAVMLVVSICLILISMAILRFTIQFTLNEEFREIGVMKAVGISTPKIRGLYIVKYFAISVVGALVGFVFSLPFQKLMMRDVSRSIIMSDSGRIILNAVCAAAVALIVVLFCYSSTRKIKKFSPIDAIRNGENGERYARKGFIRLSKGKLLPVPFMALNDIFSMWKRFLVMMVIFVLGMLLVLIPVNTINTLQSDEFITCFNMAECDHVIAMEDLFHVGADNQKLLEDKLVHIAETLEKEGIEANVFQEIMFRMSIQYKDKKTSSLAFQGIGEVTTEQYVYLEGTAPQNNHEVAITDIVAERIGAAIGDDITIRSGEEEKIYTVTALTQSMNNLGEGIRFYEKEELDYKNAKGTFGIQIQYTDHPERKEFADRETRLKELFPRGKVYTPGEYINYMIGDAAGQIQGIKQLILTVVLCINILVTILMVKSFVAKEKGEIAMLKAIGFKNSSLVAWQTIRIGMVLFVAILIATLVSSSLSSVCIGPVFSLMGAGSVNFVVEPMEVYLLYPIVVFGVTIISSMLAACPLRKISPMESSNME